MIKLFLFFQDTVHHWEQDTVKSVTPFWSVALAFCPTVIIYFMSEPKLRKTVKAEALSLFHTIDVAIVFTFLLKADQIRYEPEHNFKTFFQTQSQPMAIDWHGLGIHPLLLYVTRRGKNQQLVLLRWF